MKRSAILVFAAALAAFGARAEDLKPPSAQATATPASQAPASQAPAALSQSKFLGLLYSEIARRTPPENKAGAGDVKASFHVNAQGKIDKVVIEKTTSAAHAEMVKKILASVQAPAPPGGSCDVSQSFKFH
ncbi:MAG: energy transducer TonB [Methylocystis sp.]